MREALLEAVRMLINRLGYGLSPRLLAWAALTIAFMPDLRASTCSSLIKGELAFDVQQCGRINPEKSFPVKVDRFGFIKDFAPSDRKKFFDSYRGLYVKGLVVRSLAVRSGLSPERGALNGETIEAFVPPGLTSCAMIQSKRVKAYLDEACCAGGGDPPCLLNSTYVFTSVKPIGKPQSTAGNRVGMQLDRNPKFRKANAYFLKGNYEKAAALYQEIRSTQALDLRAEYYLGYAYRMLDNCQAALPSLERIFKSFSSGQYWAQYQKHVRRGSMLYARCLSKLKRPGEAVLVLQSFLLEARKYQDELQEALSHEDFGWIRTSKAYQDFQEVATKALGAAP